LVYDERSSLALIQVNQVFGIGKKRNLVGSGIFNLGRAVDHAALIPKAYPAHHGSDFLALQFHHNSANISIIALDWA
jgi:hypothetical protein